MHYFRLFKALILLSVLSTGCSNSTNTEIEELKRKTARLQKEVDSLKKTQATSDSSYIDALAAKQVDVKPPGAAKRNSEGQLTPGKHDFTLQWISWDEPGSVTIQPSEDGWYSIEGGQKSRKNGDYITIDGLIKQVSPTELLFKGEIKSVVATNNGGKPCIKTGSKIFKTTKNRKYWRLQDMINCEGGMLTDYVDIYF